MKECAHDTNGPDEFAVLRVIPVEDYVDQYVSESGYTGDGWTRPTVKCQECESKLNTGKEA